MTGSRLSRRTVLKGAAVTGSVMFAPATLRAADAPRHGGTLRLAIPYNPASIDPMTGRNLPDFDVLYACYDSLIDFEPTNLDLKPGLAKSWQWKNETTLLLNLTDDVQFHDGTPLDADAVKFNLERYRTDPRSNVKADLNAVGGIEVTGKNAVVLHLRRPNAGLPAILTTRAGLMVSPKSVKDHGPNVDRIAVGTGPFKFVEWQDNASFTLVRNDKYWRPGLPYLDGIKISIINELNTVVRAVMAGEADLALNLQVPQKLIADRAGDRLRIQAGPSLVYGTIFLNYGRHPLNDLRVRQALNYAIDRDELNKVLVAGLGEPSAAILPKEHWATDPSTIDFYKHDPEKARALLKEAGFGNGIELPGYGWPDQVAMQRQELLMAQFAKSGIHVKLTPSQPQQAMQSFMIEKRAEMLISPTGGYLDPSQAYEVQFAKDALRNASNIEVPGFRALMDATERTSDQAARKAAFSKLQRFVIEQALQVPQYIWPAVTIMSAKLQNVQQGLIGIPKYQEMWLRRD